MDIKKVVVIGSGTMGSGIAAHLCNANIPVTLLDLTTEISEKARDRIFKSKPPLLLDKSKAENIKVGNINDNFEPLGDYISTAKIKFVTPDSVNMIFESLSSSGETFLFEMQRFKDNKITMLIDEIKANRYVGYLENQIIEGSSIKKLSLSKPNNLHETFREVEKVVYKIKSILEN